MDIIKIFIWIGCMIVFSIGTAILKAQGIVLGGLPMMFMGAGFFAVAYGLCYIYDNYFNPRK